MFQIGVCGDLKDLAGSPKEVNILRQLGTYVYAPKLPDGTHGDNRLYTSVRGGVLGFAISAAKALAIFGLASYINPLWGWGIFIVAISSFILVTYVELKPGTYDHTRRLKLIGLGEVWAYLLLVITILPLLASWWPVALLFFVAAPVLYYFGMNKLMWPKSGSGWAPGV